MREHSFFMPVCTAFFLVVALLSAIGCRIPTSPHEVVEGREFVLSPGQEVSLRGESLRVYFRAVTEDSRCPEGGTCLWEGNAAAAFEMRTSGDAYPLVLHTHGGDSLRYPRKARFFDYELELLQLMPYPSLNDTLPIPQERYRARLVLRRL